MVVRPCIKGTCFNGAAPAAGPEGSRLVPLKQVSFLTRKPFVDWQYHFATLRLGLSKRVRTVGQAL